MNGNVDITVTTRGQGDAARKVAETKQAIDGVTKASGEASRATDKSTLAMKALKSAGDETGKGIGSLRGKILDMAGSADQSVLKVVEGMGKLGNVAGLVVGGITAIAVAIGALGDMGEKKFRDFAAAMHKSADASRDLVSGLSSVVAQSKAALEPLQKIQRAVVDTAIANAKAQGNDDLADYLERRQAKGAAISSRDTAQKDLWNARDRSRELAQARFAGEQELARLQREGGGIQDKIRDANLPGLRVGQDTQVALKMALAENGIAQLNARGALVAIEREQVDLQDRLAKQEELVKELGDKVNTAGMIEGDALVIRPDKPKPGSAPAEKRKRTLREALLAGDQAAIDAFFEADKKRATAANDNVDTSRMRDFDLDASDAQAKQDEYVRNQAEATKRLALGEPIRDFSLALAEALPNMDAFTGALSEIGAQWDAYSKGQKSLASTVTGSVGALAKAGAEHIKNERLRAGVLSIIETGLGIATSFTNPAESASHFGAALTLGSVAIFGGSSSSGGSKQERNVMRSTASAPQSAAPTVNIYGGWIGNGTPQENAYALYERMRAAYGTGFVPAFQEAA